MSGPGLPPLRSYDLNQEQRETYLKYSDLSLPRHTSYPAANYWREPVTDRDHITWMTDELAHNRDHSQVLNERGETSAALGLYVHIPFCRSLCSYCGCTREVIPDAYREASDPTPSFIQGLARERTHLQQGLAGKLTPEQIVIDKIHLGGGTPTFLTPMQLGDLWGALKVAWDPKPGHWLLKPGAELAAEIDPRVTTAEHLRVLWELGFRRLSLGVQDFDASVQSKINRVQPYSIVANMVDVARSIGFKQINFDLIYGLPGQSSDSIQKTLKLVTALLPSRIAFYRLAVMPEIFKWQKTFAHEDLPTSGKTLDFILLALETLQTSGYHFIGFDHFATTDDPLYQDYRSKTMVRNFQGMTTGSSSVTIGLGPSAISSGQTYYAQNARTASDWLRALDDGLPTRRGLGLKDWEVKRRNLLQDLYCYGTITVDSSLTSDEVAALESLTKEGLLTKQTSLPDLAQEETYQVSVLGQILTRVIGAALDPYLPKDAWRQGLTPGRGSATG